MMRFVTCTLAIGAAGLVAAAGVSADGPRASPWQAAHRSLESVHRLELEAWKKREAAGWIPYADSRREVVVPLEPRVSGLTHEVHGYHPYWMGASYLSYDWSLLSTVAFFSLEMNGAGEIVGDHGWPWSGLVSAAHQNGVRVLVTATLFSGTQLDILLASAANRQAAIDNLVGAVLQGGADGVNVDFEGVPGSRKQDLVVFLGELQAALGSALAQPYLSIATPAVDWANAFDYDELAARCDHLMVMAYDYHWAGSPSTGPVAPLAGWGPYNVSWTIQDYLLWGAPRGKILLGVPYYGYRWQAVSGDPGAATTAPGVALPYDQAAREAQIYGALWDQASSTPWYRFADPDWSQGWHEDDVSLALKYDTVWNEALGGVGIWALGYDGSRPELWSALGEAFAPPTATGDLPADGPRIALVSRGPNPFMDSIQLGLAIPSTASARLTIHDVRGRRVRQLFDGVSPLRRVHAVRWDGRDDQGREVAAGVYLARLESLGSVRSLRIVRIR